MTKGLPLALALLAPESTPRSRSARTAIPERNGHKVLKDVPAGKAVAGVPGRVIGDSKPLLRHRSMDD